MPSYAVFEGNRGMGGVKGDYKSPPPFSKGESRFERERKIRVGSVNAYTPGDTTYESDHYDNATNEKSSAQRKYEQERFRVEPGPIENYSLGRGSLARQEAIKVIMIITQPPHLSTFRCFQHRMHLKTLLLFS